MDQRLHFGKCKYMLGEARSKFNTIAGPKVVHPLNGDALKQEAIAEMERLDAEVKIPNCWWTRLQFLIC